MSLARAAGAVVCALVLACSSGGSAVPPGDTGITNDARCSTERCGEVCVDLTTDANNCGACGHSCRGQACALGVCAAEPFVTSPSLVVRMVADDSTLFWSSTKGAIYAMPLSGGTPKQIATVAFAFDVFALGANHVYVPNRTFDGDLVRFPKTGGAAETFAAGTGPNRVAVHEGNVYWCATSPAGVVVSPETTVPATPKVLDPTPSSFVAAGAFGVAFTSTTLAPSGAEVVAMNLDGSGRKVLTKVLSEPDFTGPLAFLISDSVDVILGYQNSATSSGKVVRVPLAGGSPLTVTGVVNGDGNIQGFDANARSVCWTTLGVTYCHDRGQPKPRAIFRTSGYEAIALTKDHAYLAKPSGDIVRVSY